MGTPPTDTSPAESSGVEANELLAEVALRTCGAAATGSGDAEAPTVPAGATSGPSSPAPAALPLKPQSRRAAPSRPERGVGLTTRANFGHTIGKPIADGYAPVEFADRTDFIIEVYGEPIPAIRHDRALYDPDNLRLKA